MPKAEWGTKRVCPKSAKRFYDLNKDPITCPCCGVTFDLAAFEVNKKPSRETTNVKSEEMPVSDPLGGTEEIVEDEIILEDDDTGIELEDDLLEEDVDEAVSLDEIADVAAEPDET